MNENSGASTLIRARSSGIFSRLGGIENPVDELLHALKLVHVDQLAGDGTGQPALGDFLRF
jgi:hypothetical protein